MGTIIFYNVPKFEADVMNDIALIRHRRRVAPQLKQAATRQSANFHIIRDLKL
jgi:hypothetical protein